MLWLGLLSMPLAVQAQGFSLTMLRFGCSQIVIDRIDPCVSISTRSKKGGQLTFCSLVEPGNIPSAHVHQIVGGVRLCSSAAIPLQYFSLTFIERLQRLDALGRHLQAGGLHFVHLRPRPVQLLDRQRLLPRA
jgi:hypothetical protein